MRLGNITGLLWAESIKNIEIKGFFIKNALSIWSLKPQTTNPAVIYHHLYVIHHKTKRHPRVKPEDDGGVVEDDVRGACN